MKPFWAVLEGSYGESLTYRLIAADAADAVRRIREQYGEWDYSIAALFDTAPVQGDFEEWPWPL